MEKKLRIIVVDDHPLYQDGVVRTLQDSGVFDVVGTGENSAQAVQLSKELKPDVALLDISMPGGGLEALSEIAAAKLQTRIVMLTVSESDSDVLGALNSGAAGYVLKGVGGAELVSILSNVAEGGSYVSPALAARVMVAMQADKGKETRSSLDDLTGREEQVLKLVSKGKSNKEVARELDLQEKTVKHHMTSILNKLKVRNRVEAAVLAKDLWA
ncbi:Two-component transcriptional response regulator, LuxR family [hydrothermal vent metagenome]|uniref:Two-component transcriptional response regulator, LuxR family n=1 Tax=hydrothermal vent metagenome TaxID=652676 RepID=A0A3B0UQ08_9ZZZZ